MEAFESEEARDKAVKESSQQDSQKITEGSVMPSTNAENVKEDEDASGKCSGREGSSGPSLHKEDDHSDSAERAAQDRTSLTG